MSIEAKPRETTVLLVEDDRDDFFLTEDLLKCIQRETHRVVWAVSYEAAKTELSERPFDVALVDYRIDGRTGLEFISEVGSNFPHCPMILLTGLQDPDLDLAAQQAGAVDYLAKDSLTSELLDRSIRYARQNTQRWTLLNTVLENAAAGGAEAAGNLVGFAGFKGKIERQRIYSFAGGVVWQGEWEIEGPMLRGGIKRVGHSPAVGCR